MLQALLKVLVGWRVILIRKLVWISGQDAYSARAAIFHLPPNSKIRSFLRDQIYNNPIRVLRNPLENNSILVGVTSPNLMSYSKSIIYQNMCGHMWPALPQLHLRPYSETLYQGAIPADCKSHTTHSQNRSWLLASSGYNV